MKLKTKIIISIIASTFICIILDFICIFTFKRPIFAIETIDNTEYKGLLYNTYNCSSYSYPQIKTKNTKFSCSVKPKKIGNVVAIVDETEICAQAIEIFYIDEKYIYSFGCIKSNSIIVKYDSNYQEPLSEALKNKRITIKDLDKYNIGYIKEERQALK